MQSKNFSVKKKILLCVFVMITTLIMCIISYANEWKYVHDEWYYLDKNGQAYANSFVERDGNKYFVGDDGKVVRNEFFEFGNYYYYADANGILARNKFQYIEYDIADRATKDPGTYYFGDNHRCYKRVGSSFRRMIEGNYYAFDENGLVLSGWLDIEGHKMENVEDALLEGVYYADEHGMLYINRWLDYNATEETYSLDQNETALGNMEYNYLDHMWLYFDDEGKKVKAGGTEKEINRVLNGKEYAFDENGVMISNFTKAGGVSLAQQSNPTAIKHVKLYGDQNNGALEKGCWKWLYPSEELDKTEYEDQEMHWWYVDKAGNLVTNKIKEIDGKKYVFDGIGRLKAGFVLFQGGRNYAANYMPEDLVSDDFKYTVTEGSKLHGQDLCDIRYFGDDDKLDGSMRYGDIEIELADGVHTFKFAKSGVAFGNHHTLKKAGNTYYVNGLRLEANEDMRYGIVKVDDTTYKLVDQQGKIRNGSKKIVTDDEGNFVLMMSNQVVGYKTANSLPSGDVIIKWRGQEGSEPSGFYYYHKDAPSGVDKYHYGLCLNPSVTTTLTTDDLDNITDSMKVNFR